MKITEAHFIKALAWDALYAAWQVQAEVGTDDEKESAEKQIALMKAYLSACGEKMEKPETWEGVKE